MKRLFLMLLSMAAFVGSFAQEKSMVKNPRWGRIFVDFNISGVTIDKDVEIVALGSGEKDRGFTFGVLQDFQLGKSPLYFETGLYMDFCGCSYKVYDDLAKERFLHLGMPLNLALPIGEGDVSFIPSVGLVPQLFAVGNLEIDNHKYDVFSDYQFKQAAYKRFQFGFNIGASVAIKRYIINYNFTRNFTKMEKQLGTKMLSHNFGVGYLF